MAAVFIDYFTRKRERLNSLYTSYEEFAKAAFVYIHHIEHTADYTNAQLDKKATPKNSESMIDNIYEARWSLDRAKTRLRIARSKLSIRLAGEQSRREKLDEITKYLLSANIEKNKDKPNAFHLCIDDKPIRSNHLAKRVTDWCFEQGSELYNSSTTLGSLQRLNDDKPT